MTSDTKIKWEGAGTTLPSGHRVIETHEYDRVPGFSASKSMTLNWAIMDTSGGRPEDTDDGILWLDKSRCLDASTRHSPIVPVVNMQGEKFGVRIDSPTLLMLARMFRWTIEDEVRGHFYSVS